MEANNIQFKESVSSESSNRRVLRSSSSSSSLMSNTSTKINKLTTTRDSNKENGLRRVNPRKKSNQQDSSQENNFDDVLQHKNDAEIKKTNPFKIFEISGSDKETSNSEFQGKEDNRKRSSLKETKKLSKKEQIDKKSVRIIEAINEKNDCLNNICCDNKKTYTKSTSTPSGLRRKPLKAPHDLSIIDKTE
jgi:hypothetical protein